MAAKPTKMQSYMREVFQVIGEDFAPMLIYGRPVYRPTVVALKTRGLVETADREFLWRVTEAGKAEQQLYRQTFGRG